MKHSSLIRAGAFLIAILSVWGHPLPSLRAAGANEVTLVPAGSCWRYWDQGGDLGMPWRERGFVDNAWPAGAAELGYGDGDEATVIGFGLDPQNKHVTTYFRHAFNLLNPGDYTNFVLRVRRDDGIVVYLNGVEIIRDNLPSGAISAGTLATLAADDGSIFQVFSVAAGGLLEAENVLAAEVHQASSDSDDLSFDLELVGQAGLRIPTLTIATPGPGSVQFSWPGSSRSDFTLQCRSNLSPTEAWLPVSEVLSFSDGGWSVTTPRGSGSKFYRLCAADGIPPLCPPPTVVTQTLSAAAPVGSDVTLSVTASGGPGLTYLWRRNEVFLLGETGSTLTLTNAQRRDGGIYDVLIGNECACTPSCPIPVRIGGEKFPLADTFAGRAQTNSATGAVNALNAGATREFGEPSNPVRIFGHTVWLEWIAPDTGIVQFDTHGSGQDTALAVYTNALLSNLALQASAGPVGRPRTSEVVLNVQSGQVLQIAVDGNGFSPLLALNWNLIPTVDCAPQVIVPPLTQVVPAGSDVAFTVVVTTCDPNPLSYQWFRTGTAIGGATNSSLLLTNVQVADAAQYRVSVSNGQGATDSGAGSLVVLDSGNITLPREDFIKGGVCAGKLTNKVTMCFKMPSTTATACSVGDYPQMFPDGTQTGPGQQPSLNPLSLSLTVSTVHPSNYGLDTAIRLSTHNNGATCNAPSCTDPTLAIACSKLSTRSIAFGTCTGPLTCVLVTVYQKATASYTTGSYGTCPATAPGPVTVLHQYVP